MGQDRVCRARRGLFNRGVLFLDDNARPHTARDAMKTHLSPEMREIGSPGLSPRSCTIRLSPFSCTEISQGVTSEHAHQTGVKAAKNFLRSLGTDFYQDGFSKLISRYDKSINDGGEYVKK
ncbi:hypothetical protein AVEN_170891-1 [Araneus ventricosus]|uniref:Histone-lysine N-methyltransferase SETMAR n=1 Tax=Araneus ventricosus TaxID=182803 RepID=A0A4Y2UMK8_ARAVE|nr:hypothetical protein AVEN_170891-1 [Araneus ventricosus]